MGLFSKNKQTKLTLEVKQLLYESYFERVYKLSLYITRDNIAAEEVSQEVFITAFEKYKQLRDPSKVGAWLNTICLNKARSFLRQEKKVIPLEVECLNNKQLNSFADISDIIEEKETSHELRQAIRDLLPKFQDVIILKYYLDLEVIEISKILNIPEGTVKSRLSRAREKLKKILEQTECVIKNEGGESCAR